MNRKTIILFSEQLTTQGGHYGLYHTDPQLPPPPYPYLERRDRSFNAST